MESIPSAFPHHLSKGPVSIHPSLLLTLHLLVSPCRGEKKSELLQLMHDNDQKSF